MKPLKQIGSVKDTANLLEPEFTGACSSKYAALLQLEVWLRDNLLGALELLFDLLRKLGRRIA